MHMAEIERLSGCIERISPELVRLVVPVPSAESAGAAFGDRCCSNADISIKRIRCILWNPSDVLWYSEPVGDSALGERLLGERLDIVNCIPRCEVLVEAITHACIATPTAPGGRAVVFPHRCRRRPLLSLPLPSRPVRSQGCSGRRLRRRAPRRPVGESPRSHRGRSGRAMTMTRASTSKNGYRRLSLPPVSGWSLTPA